MHLSFATENHLSKRGLLIQAVINNRLVDSLRPQDRPYEVNDLKVKGFILRVQPTGRMTYICQYGRSKRVTIGRADFLTPTQARDKAKEILADVVKGVDPVLERKQNKEHTLSTYIESVYSPWVENHHRNGQATIDRLKANFMQEFGNKKLNEINAWTVEKWRSAKLKKGIKPATINRDLNGLKAALSRAVEWGFIDSHPLSTIKPIKLDSASYVRFLEDDEEDRLMTALDEREERIRTERDSANKWRIERGYKLLPDLRIFAFADYLKPLVILSLNTGLRRGELFNLKWPDIDLNRAIITIQGEKAKSGKTRHAPLNADALESLKLWKDQSHKSDLVFPGKDNQPLTNVNNSWFGILKAAKISNFRFHDMRHHFASRLVMAGVDLNTVRELLGHSDTKMTLRYAHLAPRIKAEAVERIVRNKSWKDLSGLNHAKNR